MKTLRKSIGGIAAVSLLCLAIGQAAPTSSAAPAQASKAATVDIHDFAFHPGTLNVAKGTKVLFSNTSDVTHTATRAKAFDTGRIKPGTSVSVRFTQKGSFPYHCKIHSFMHGKIVVG